MDEEQLRKWCQREYMQIRAARSRLRNEEIAAEAEGMMRALATMLALLEDATPDSTDRMPPLGAQLKEDK